MAVARLRIQEMEEVLGCSGLKLIALFIYDAAAKSVSQNFPVFKNNLFKSF
jgi:hypothetical protein